MATYETEAIVLRTIRYSEADSVLTLLTADRGRVSAMAKGARRPKSRLGGRLQPGVRAQVILHEGRGEMHGLRGAVVRDPHAGLWSEGYRLLAASSVLEAAARVLPEGEAQAGAFHLIGRSLDLLSRATPRSSAPRLDPIVLGTHCKLLVVSGLLPRLGSCVGCGADEDLVSFSAAQGGAVCRECDGDGEPVAPGTFAALAGLLAAPLGEAEIADVAAAAGAERVVGIILREHLGVTLRSAAQI